MKIELGLLGLMIIATLFGGSGAFFLKKSMIVKFPVSLIILVKNKNLVTGLFLSIIGLSINIFAYSLGDLSVIFPITSLNYIWSTILAVTFLNEKLHSEIIIGLSFIVLGVVLVTN